jgi:hypothetical protein
MAKKYSKKFDMVQNAKLVFVSPTFFFRIPQNCFYCETPEHYLAAVEEA